MGDKGNRTSVIVVSYGNWKITERCIHSIERCTSNYELVVIDNRSPDETPVQLMDFAEHHRVILNEENIGYAAAVNQGIRMTESQKIVILNNDVIVTPNWLDFMLPLSTVETVVVPLSTACYHGQEIQGVDTHVTDVELAEIAKRVAMQNKNKFKYLNFAAGFCMLFDREMFNHIGLFDEDLRLAADDFELAMRMKRRGYRFVLSLSTVVLHLGHRAFQSDLERAESMASASWRHFEKKYPQVLISDFEQEFQEDGGPAFLYLPESVVQWSSTPMVERGDE
ncbi:MAG: glycosyltransferase family 2 protein [Alicyclobacillaceae bacterium]|nr:glycosyltransferase family 2 protein [Alicyclobacillaceae bacterium]